MKKLIYAALSVAIAVAAQGCSNQQSNGSDSDTMACADSTEAVQCDSAADTVATEVAKVDTVAKEEAAPVVDNANAEKIDKKLKEFGNYVSDIKDTFYDGGTFYPSNDAEARATMINPAVKLDKELKAMESDMTDAQKAKFNKLRNSVKQALQ